MGLISGFAETVEYTCQVCSLLWYIGLTTSEFGLHHKIQPVLWVTILLIISLFNYFQKSYYSTYYFVFPIVTSVLLLIYCVGNAPEMNFSKYALSQEEEGVNAYSFFHGLPSTTIYYIGLEALPLWCKDIEKVSVV